MREAAACSSGEGFEDLIFRVVMVAAVEDITVLVVEGVRKGRMSGGTVYPPNGYETEGLVGIWI